jgi:hypothetical protein
MKNYLLPFQPSNNPDGQILGNILECEPSKPSIPGFDGFDGSISTDFQNFDENPETHDSAHGFGCYHCGSPLEAGFVQNRCHF